MFSKNHRDLGVKDSKIEELNSIINDQRTTIQALKKQIIWTLSVMWMPHPLFNMSMWKTISVSVVFYDSNIKSMLDSRQRAELEELKKFLSTRQIWARIGLFISCLISFSANGTFGAKNHFNGHSWSFVLYFWIAVLKS